VFRTIAFLAVACVLSLAATVLACDADHQIWDQAGGYIPAAFSHALGPHHMVALRHGDIRYFTRTGQMTLEQRLNAPDGVFPGSGNLYEPKITFDPYARRFLIAGGDTYGSADGGDSSPGNYLGIAASHGEDPHGGWVGKYIHVSFLLAPEYFASHPRNVQLGLDAHAVYIAWDNRPNNPHDDTGWLLVLDREALFAGEDPVANHLLVSDVPVASVAATTFDADAPAQYLVTTYGSPSGTTRLRMWAVRDPLGSPVLDLHVLDLPPFQYAPFTVPSQDSPDGIDTGDSRVQSAVYRDGSLWVTHHGRPGAEDRVLAIWYEIAMNGWPVSGSDPEILQHGTIDPGPGIHTWVPSLAVDAEGTVVFSYARSAADEMHAIGRCYRLATDEPGTLQGHAVVKQGEIGAVTPGPVTFARYFSAAADPDLPGIFSAGGVYRRPNQWGGASYGMWGADVCTGLAPSDVNTGPTPYLLPWLSQNHPNPFNPATTITFSVTVAGPVSLRVHDSSGRLVRTLVDAILESRQDTYAVTWDGRSDAGRAVPSGLYLYRLTTANTTQARKMLLIR
jgi:hypothetical protein